MLPPDFKVTSEMLWRGPLLFALVDAGLVSLLAWFIKPVRLRQLMWPLVATTAVFWGSLWAWVLSSFRDSVYSYIFPGWMRWLLPVAYGLVFATVALVIWRLALRLPGNAVVNFCLLGGLWGMITHVWALYLGIVDKPPMLQGSSPAAAVLVAVFEFVLYWCIILSIATLVQRGWRWLRALRQQRIHVT